MVNCKKCNDKCIPVYELGTTGSNVYICRNCALHITKDMEVKSDKRLNEVKKPN